MATPTYKFNYGEPIVLGRQVNSGDPVGVVVEAELKRAPGKVVPPVSSSSMATFDVAFVAAVGEIPAHWILSLTPVVMATLAPGIYVTDCKLSQGGEIIEVTDPAFIHIQASVSGA